MPGYPGAVSWVRRNGREFFLKNGWGSPWDTILNEPVPRLIRMLVCDCFLCPIGGQHLSRCFRDPLIRRSLPANSAVRRTHLARAGKLSPRWVFSESGPPLKTKKFQTLACWQNKTKRKMHQRKKSDWGLIEGKFVIYSNSFVPSSCVTEEKNLQTVKGTYLTTIYAELS